MNRSTAYSISQPSATPLHHSKNSIEESDIKDLLTKITIFQSAYDIEFENKN